jgi:hypothetical protein
MSNETELERLVVRLIGDAESYKAMLVSSQHDTEEAMHAVEHSAQGMSAAVVMQGELAAHAIEQLGHKFLELGKEALHAFEGHEDTEVKLQAAIKANGGAVDETMEKYEAFAAQMARMTTSGTAQTMHLLQLAQSYGLTGEKAEQAAKDAIGLEAATGHAAEGAIRIVSLYRQSGDVGRLGYMLPMLRSIKDPTERAAMAAKLLAGDFETAKAVAGTFSGQMKQLENDMHGLWAEIGKVIATAIKPFIAVEREMVAWFKELSPTVKGVIVAVAGLAASFVLVSVAMTALAPVFSSMATLVGVIFSPAGAVFVGILAAAGAAAAGLAYYLGGIEKIWRLIKYAASEFKPVIFEIGQVINAAFNAVGQLVTGFNRAAEAAGGVDEAIMKLGIHAVAKTVQRQLIGVEYRLLHIQDEILNIGLKLLKLLALLPQWMTGMTDAETKAVNALSSTVSAEFGAGFEKFYAEKMKEVNKASEDGKTGFNATTKAAKAMKSALEDAVSMGSGEYYKRMQKFLGTAIPAIGGDGAAAAGAAAHAAAGAAAHVAAGAAAHAAVAKAGLHGIPADVRAARGLPPGMAKGGTLFGEDIIGSEAPPPLRGRGVPDWFQHQSGIEAVVLQERKRRPDQHAQADEARYVGYGDKPMGRNEQNAFFNSKIDTILDKMNTTLTGLTDVLKDSENSYKRKHPTPPIEVNPMAFN